MVMYKCNKCGELSEEVETKNVCLEDLYGVGSDFQYHHYQNVSVCPSCGSDDIEEIDGDYCDMCGEFTSYSDLEDTEGLPDGGIGKICPDCWRDNYE